MSERYIQETEKGLRATKKGANTVNASIRLEEPIVQHTANNAYAVGRATTYINTVNLVLQSDCDNQIGVHSTSVRKGHIYADLIINLKRVTFQVDSGASGKSSQKWTPRTHRQDTTR